MQLKYLLLISLTIPVLISSVTIQVNAQENQTDSNNIDFLLIQHAESGSISEINSTSYLLELDNIPDKVVLFSDRPDRIVLTETIDNFIGNWSVGEDSFQADPPNAVLVVLEENNQKEDTFVIELFNPEYNKGQKALKYDITFLGNETTSSDLPTDLGKSVLVIDLEKRLGHGMG